MAARASQYDQILEKRIKTLEETVTDLTEQHNSLVEDRDSIQASLRKAHARLDEAANAFNQLVNSRPSPSQSKTPQSDKVVRAKTSCIKRCGKEFPAGTKLSEVIEHQASH